ncbi:MAG: tRNA pseudouridine(55) synthase TruB [Clostridiales bacterium]|nr:tRNA pseudouridine(55) synthase TruB [Clostridiales bacterium]
MTGFINVNKRQGTSSAQEVAKIRRLTNTPCGHMGTLDPMASGVLPVAIGNAARLFDYFLGKNKTYIATFKFGVDSDTLDTTGEITFQGGRIPTAIEISDVLNEFTGEVEQLPPKYSAKCINGKRGYQLAREGVEFELSPKKVTIHGIKLLQNISADEYSFEIECGGGTYIRSIARDLGVRLGTSAIMSSLVRTKSGPFTLDNSVQSNLLSPQNMDDYIIKTQDVLSFESIYPSETEAKKLLNGLSVVSERADGIYKFFNTDGSFYGLAEVKQKVLKVRTKLC